MSGTALIPELDALVNVARVLPPELIRAVTDFAVFLGIRHAAVDESDACGEEDLRDLTRASAQAAARFPAAS